MAHNSRITIESGKRGGKPCIRGLRITVHDVLEQLSMGQSIEEIIEEFPELEGEDISACQSFAADTDLEVDQACGVLNATHGVTLEEMDAAIKKRGSEL